MLILCECLTSTRRLKYFCTVRMIGRLDPSIQRCRSTNRLERQLAATIISLHIFMQKSAGINVQRLPEFASDYSHTRMELTRCNSLKQLAGGRSDRGKGVTENRDSVDLTEPQCTSQTELPPPKDRSNNAPIAMVAGVPVRSLSDPMSVREQANRGRGEAISSRHT